MKRTTGSGRPRILLIGTKFDEPHILRKAFSAGVEPILIQKKDELEPSHVAEGSTILLHDYQQVETLLPLAQGLHDALHFQAVVSLRELALLPAARVNDDLQFNGTSYATALVLKDKRRMRERLAEANLSPVRTLATTSELHELERAAASIGYPLIVKPVDAAGSYCIFRLNAETEVAAASAQLVARGVHDVLVEEYLDGAEISVETFSFDGHHVVIAITDKMTNEYFAEIGHIIPSTLAGRPREAVEKLVSQFLDVVGLTDGPAHTELKLTSHGPRIIESHNRIGGDFINLLVETAYGIDMSSLAFSWAVRTTQPLRSSPVPLGAAAVRFLTAVPGVVQAVSGLETVQSHADVLDVSCYRGVGAVVGKAENSLERSGHVVIRASDPGSARARCEALAQMISIQTSRAEQTAAVAHA